MRPLPPLPYAKDALEPYVSGLTLEVHYEKHHRGYADKLEKLLAGKPEEHATLDQLIHTADGAIYDNAAQVWNHTFFWRSMSPVESSPSGELLAAIENQFGSVSELKKRLVEAASAHFGSGWAWLVLDPRDRLRVVSTHDAENPLRGGAQPLLTIDVWEHAYYLDFLNDRERYVQGVVDHLLDWNFAAENLRLATAGAEPPSDDVTGAEARPGATTKRGDLMMRDEKEQLKAGRQGFDDQREPEDQPGRQKPKGDRQQQDDERRKRQKDDEQRRER
jgi:Fe-Mn family superoxide dismutase